MKYHTPTVPMRETVQRLFNIGLIVVVMAVSVPNKSISADTGTLPAPAKLPSVASAADSKDYAFTLPKYTKVTVLRSYPYVPMTAYTSRPEETDSTPFITADGSHVRDGIVAANFLPFGTKVRIPALFGDKIFEVHDRMNKRYYYKMDFWMDDLGKARKFGVRYATIEVVETEERN
jgi:3D (Asp-Asp-Asp) domain-containing protein